MEYLFEQEGRLSRPSFNTVQQCLYLLTLASTDVQRTEQDSFPFVDEDEEQRKNQGAGAALDQSFVVLFREYPGARHNYNRLKWLYDLLWEDRAFYNDPGAFYDDLLRHGILEQLVCAYALFVW